MQAFRSHHQHLGDELIKAVIDQHVGDFITNFGDGLIPCLHKIFATKWDTKCFDKSAAVDTALGGAAGRRLNFSKRSRSQRAGNHTLREPRVLVIDKLRIFETYADILNFYII